VSQPPRRPARVVVLVSGAGTNLQALIDAAQDPAYGVRVVADELEYVEVGDDGRHDECEHALPGELADRRPRRRLQLVVVEREPHVAQLAGETGARPRRVVGDVTQRVTGSTELRDRVRRARNGLSGDVQNAVDVEQNARHGA